MTDLSPFEEAIANLRAAHPPPPEAESAERCGPRSFVDKVVELEESVREGGNENRVSVLRADTLDLGYLVGKVADPWAEVRTLFVRAFQSMLSRKELKRFVMAIDDGRLSASPVNLARIDPSWCTPEHNLFMFCWGRLSKATEKGAEKKARGEMGLGRAVAKQLTAGMKKSKSMEKAVGPVVKRLLAHDPSMQLLGRLVRFVRADDTSALMALSLIHI